MNRAGRPKYKTVDWRAVVKCDICRCWLEGPDKAAHSQWHVELDALFQNALFLKVAGMLPTQDMLPPF